MNTQESMDWAREHVKRVQDFLYHLVTYVVVNTLLIIIDLRADTAGDQIFGLDFAYWPILFWGLGVMGHAISVFVGDRRVRTLAERDRSRHLSSH
ncbi:MAG: 2TM domain-containing protein [Acidimicrobiia bacterium]|nr:2TM domain-containing protein [Acidimicrobiia bacterium]